MELIDFLKYGAMGISLALAILSYRLLSKEQDKENVREPMLKSIKNYFILAVLLSVFFGVIEIVGKVFLQGNKEQSAEIDEIWKANFNKLPDTTYKQKVKRISDNINSDSKTDTAEVCSEIILELEKYKQLAAEYDKGFYQNIIKLRKSLTADPDGWINLDFQTARKSEIISSLKGILNSLGNNYDNLPDEEIVTKWKLLKRNWSNDKTGYVFLSDIPQIVKEYLKTYN